VYENGRPVLGYNDVGKRTAGKGARCLITGDNFWKDEIYFCSGGKSTFPHKANKFPSFSAQKTILLSTGTALRFK